MSSRSEQTISRNASSAGAVACAAALTALFHTLAFTWLWPYIMDDAFITYRYARHLGQGLGPIWNNPGALHPVEGYSSFLHMFLLGGLHALTNVDVQILGKTLGLVFSLAAIACVACQAWRSGLSIRSSWLALSPFWLPPMIMASASGMETTLFVMFAWLTSLACVRLLEQRASRGGEAVLVGLGFLGTLTRPEFALSAIALYALVAWRRGGLRRSLGMVVLVLYILPGLALTAWRFATYGDVVPNTFYAKQRLPGLWGATYVGRFLVICGLPYLVLASTAARRLWSERRDLVLVVLLSVGLPCLYVTSIRPLMGWWYRFLIPQLPLLAWLAAVAVSTEPADAAVRNMRWLRRTAVAALLVLGLAQVPPIVRFVPFRHADDERLDELGRRLRPWATPQRWFSYFDVGRLPYAAEWNVIDVVGLTTRRSDLGGDCRNATDLLLRSLTSSPAAPPQEIVNPCPKIYEFLADLDFFAEPPLLSSRMRIFARRDLSYREPLRQALVEGWPDPYVHSANWLTRFDAISRDWFGR